SLGGRDLPGGSQANCQRPARSSGAGRAATGWKPVDALANANPATGALRSQSTGAPPEPRQKTPSCTGKIGTERARAKQRILDARRRLSEAYAQLANRPIWQAMKDPSLLTGELR